MEESVMFVVGAEGHRTEDMFMILKGHEREGNVGIGGGSHKEGEQYLWLEKGVTRGRAVFVVGAKGPRMEGNACASRGGP